MMLDVFRDDTGLEGRVTIGRSGQVLLSDCLRTRENRLRPSIGAAWGWFMAGPNSLASLPLLLGCSRASRQAPHHGKSS